ncbi:MAG: hypothetical protein Q9210_006657, partial [Variospora velana]
MAYENADRQLALSLAQESVPPYIDIYNGLEESDYVLSPSVLGVEPSFEAASNPASNSRVNTSMQSNEMDSGTQVEATPYATHLLRAKESLGTPDLKIICGTESFNVHKAVICPQSKFFAAAVEAGFKDQESISGTVSLVEEDPQIIQRLMSFFYTGDYGDLPSIQPSFFFVHEYCDAGTDDRRQESLILHCAMYACADRYSVADLKTQAEGKFQALVVSFWPLKELPTLIADVYTSTPSNDRGLRDSIVRICSKHINEIVAGPSWQHIVKIEAAGQLALDLLPLVLASKDQALHLAEARASSAEERLDDWSGLSSLKKKKMKRSM